MRESEIREFRARYGVLGEAEKRSFSLTGASVKNTGDGSDRLKVVGHAAVFNSPSVEIQSRYGAFIERISPRAFDAVLATNPDTLLTWDHSTLHPLARTNGTLELSATSRGLRFFATCSRTSYSEDLRQLMADGVVNESSFLFSVAPGGESWDMQGETVQRTITNVGALFDVCITAQGAYPATDSGIARTLMIDYAQKRGLLRSHPDAQGHARRLQAEVALRRRKLSLSQ